MAGSNDKSNNKNKVVLAAVEGGGTSFRVAVVVVFVYNGCDDAGNSNNNKNKNNTCPPLDPLEIVARESIDSSGDNPQQTLSACCDFFRKHKPANRGYDALGIAIFGPVGLHAADHSDTYGTILGSSPKAAWRKVDFLSPLQRACQGDNGIKLPVLVETDVNAPALAEYLGARKIKKDISSCAYITVGTGVGVGLVVNGQTVHGASHPEGGHLVVQPLEGDTFPGYSWGIETCPYRGVHTVEGIASSVALTERYLLSQGRRNTGDRSILATLHDDDPIFDHAANAVANLCATLLLLLSMEKIVLGGGLMNRAGLSTKIQQRTVTLLNGYLPNIPPPGSPDMDFLICVSEHGKDAGLHGAIVLAQQAWRQSQQQTPPTPEDEKTMKQVAFGVGLWHGMIVGAIVTAGLFQWLATRRRKN